MKAKNVYLGTLMMTLLALGATQAQDRLMSYPNGGGVTSGRIMTEAGGTVTTVSPMSFDQRGANLQPSEYLQGTCPDCCGPTGGCRHIHSELFFRTGPSFTFGKGNIGEVLETGRKFEAGGRVLFYTPDYDSAWNIDISISDTFNKVESPAPVVTLRNVSVNQVGQQGGLVPPILPAVNVTPQSLHRTYLSMGVGREWYVMGHGGPGNCDGGCNGCGDGWNLRWGVDGGGRWGQSKVQFAGLVPVGVQRHFDDVIGGVYFALHSDIEFPCGCCTFFAGGRVEFSHTWTDILQDDSQITDIAVLLTLGTRF